MKIQIIAIDKLLFVRSIEACRQPNKDLAINLICIFRKLFIYNTLHGHSKHMNILPTSGVEKQADRGRYNLKVWKKE